MPQVTLESSAANIVLKISMGMIANSTAAAKTHSVVHMNQGNAYVSQAGKASTAL